MPDRLPLVGGSRLGTGVGTLQTATLLSSG